MSKLSIIIHKGGAKSYIGGAQPVPDHEEARK